MEKWEIFQRKKNIEEQRFSLPNGHVGKAYQVCLDFEKLEWGGVVLSGITGLDNIGLSYDNKSRTISGLPLFSADLKLIFCFELDAERIEKTVPFAVNPDPRSLWKNLESDRQDPWWKSDEVQFEGRVGSKKMVAVSKRGRAHANKGGFREDHFEFVQEPKSEWGILAVADGAGSAGLSRLGSKVACEAAIDYFMTLPTTVYESLASELIAENNTASIAKTPSLALHLLKPAISYVYEQLKMLADSLKTDLSEFHSTLALTLIKPFDFGWVILTFSVGDCPIALIDNEKVIQMNWLDAGDYGGATRFVTMPEIFTQADFDTRFGYHVVKNFSYLMVMSDGIYDPKFETSFNLSQLEKWQDLLRDLDGDNPEGSKVDFKTGNPGIAAELSKWMDFWSTGNHDDRTLVIIY